MAFVLAMVGLLMIVTGAKGTYAQFGAQVAKDFTGPQPFTYWIAAIGAVGAVGYIEALRVPSRMFMALLILAMVLANKGFFAQFQAALKSGPIAPPAGPAMSAAQASGAQSPYTTTPPPASANVSPNGADTATNSFKRGNGDFWRYFGVEPLGRFLGAIP